MPQMIPHLLPLYDNLNTAAVDSATAVTDIKSTPPPTSSSSANHPQALPPSSASANVNENPQLHRQCKSTRSKYSSVQVSKVGSGAASRDSMESVEDSGDSLPGSPRRVNNLRAPDRGLLVSGAVEYGTVLIYTCAASCWRGSPVPEAVVVQQELI